MRRVLIVKKGALGDVVRTSYFARALKEQRGGRTQITWFTAPDAIPLLRFNPWIDRIVTSSTECAHECFDHIYSLDDEKSALEVIKLLQTSAITGAYLDGDLRSYTADAAIWFDMGLLSRFGKQVADELKKANTRGHADIFCKIFGVSRVRPCFYGDPHEERRAKEWLGNDSFVVAVNPFAGGRWPSKELRASELQKLVATLINMKSPDQRSTRVLLLGAGPDRERNIAFAANFGSERVWVVDTDSSVLRLAAVIRCSDVLISSDSLALHLGIAQNVPFVAFFAPTSAAEIDDFGLGVKVASTAVDYCSYRPDADNTSITAERLIQAYGSLLSRSDRILQSVSRRLAT